MGKLFWVGVQDAVEGPRALEFSDRVVRQAPIQVGGCLSAPQLVEVGHPLLAEVGIPAGSIAHCNYDHGMLGVLRGSLQEGHGMALPVEGGVEKVLRALSGLRHMCQDGDLGLPEELHVGVAKADR